MTNFLYDIVNNDHFEVLLFVNVMGLTKMGFVLCCRFKRFIKNTCTHALKTAFYWRLHFLGSQAFERLILSKNEQIRWHFQRENKWHLDSKLKHLVSQIVKNIEKDTILSSKMLKTTSLSVNECCYWVFVFNRDQVSVVRQSYIRNIFLCALHHGVLQLLWLQT